MIDEETLGDVVGLGRVLDDEILGLLAGVFPLSRWESGDRVTYLHPEQGHALDVVYGKRGNIARCEPGPGLTDALVAALRERTEAAFASDAGYEVRREVLFSVPEVRGFWRHGDDWQILPAPATAARPGFVMGEYPFVLEYRVRTSTSFGVSDTRRWRRLWELHLLLSLLLRGQVIRESLAHPHHWVLLPEPTTAGSHTVYANEGYIVGCFVARAADFSDVAGHRRLTMASDEEYYAHRGIRPDDEVFVPACLDTFFDNFDNANPRTREQLLRACYWSDAACRVWHASKSLSYLAAITAVETLLPTQQADPCPCCNRDRSPGPTARFRTFVETHAAAAGTEARAAMYRFRSTLVHGGGLHSMDLPGAWGALVPGDMAHRELRDAAFAVSRTAIRSWFLEQTYPTPVSEAGDGAQVP